MCRDGFHDNICCVFYFMLHFMLHVVGLYGCQLYLGKEIWGFPRKIKKVNNLAIRIVMIFVII